MVTKVVYLHCKTPYTIEDLIQRSGVKYEHIVFHAPDENVPLVNSSTEKIFVSRRNRNT